MRLYLRNMLIGSSILMVVLACGVQTPVNTSSTEGPSANQPTPSDQQFTPQNPPSATPEPFRMPTGRLLISSGPDVQSLQWYVVNLPDMTTEPYAALEPSDGTQYDDLVSVAPDFGHFTFERVVGSDPQASTATLYVVDISTGMLAKVASTTGRNVVVNTRWPSWSQDGQWLSYAGSDSGLSIFDINSAQLRNPESALVAQGIPQITALSPNGDRVAYSFYEYNAASDSGLFMSNTDGSNERLLVEGKFPFVVWHPDGTRLYLAELGRTEMVPHIYRFDLETASKVEIPDANYLFYPLMLSPNGKFLAYVDSKRGLSFLNTEDDSILPVSFSISLGGDWSPDSRYIISYGDPGRYARILDVQTGAQAQIDLSYSDSTVHGWLP